MQYQHLLVAQTGAHLATPDLLLANRPMQSYLEGTAMIHAQLCLFFYLLITFLVLQALFLTWRCWSILSSLVLFAWKPVQRKSHCVWCWDAWHIRGWYPERWSSTMCLHHRRAHTRQLQARRLARQSALPETLPACLVSVHQARSERVEPVEVLS